MKIEGVVGELSDRADRKSWGMRSESRNDSLVGHSNMCWTSSSSKAHCSSEFCS